jgi:hypothetical protein
MDKLQTRRISRRKTHKIKVSLTLISFKENNVIIIYSPALDLSGYGKNESEAKQSFEIAIEEFLRYTIDKGTFESELKKLGWKISEKEKSVNYKQPYLDQLLRDNKYLCDIVREKEFHRINKNVTFPAFT